MVHFSRSGIIHSPKPAEEYPCSQRKTQGDGMIRNHLLDLTPTVLQVKIDGDRSIHYIITTRAIEGEGNDWISTTIYKHQLSPQVE